MSRPGLLVPGASLAQMQDRLLSRDLGLGLGRVIASSGSITVTAAGTTHTMGAWAQAVAAMPEAAGAILVMLQTISHTGVGTDSSGLLNVGIGGAGSEVVAIDYLGTGWIGGQTEPMTTHYGWLFPFYVPKGSRVAMQYQHKTINRPQKMRLFFFELMEGLVPSSRITALGAAPASSRGTTLTAPASDGVKGAWTQLIAATVEPYAVLGVSMQGGADTTQGSGVNLVDIGIGAAGAEVVIIPDIEVQTTTAEQLFVTHPVVHAVNVPKGSRLAARYQSTAASVCTLDASLHGVRPAA